MLELNNISEENRKNVAFQLVVAMRDIISIANKKKQKPTYENSIRLFHDFNPELYEDIIKNLPQRNLSDEAKVFIAKAEAISIEQQKQVSALEILQEEIDSYKKLLKQGELINPDTKKALKNKIGSLESIKKSLLPRKISENRILIRDTSRANREDFGAKYLEGNDFFVDYKLTNDKYLRIRLLHPDKPEHLTGADLIYEQHDESKGLIRIVFLQYKIWDNGVLYFSKVKNLDEQIKKLQSCLCDQDYCESLDLAENIKEFRFPYCCAFLRPTDKLQEQNERLISSGIHIPICAIEKLKIADGNKIEKKYLKYSSLTHEFFEHLFNRGFVGSAWLKEEELEDFYKKYKILENDESITFYAREIKEVKEENEFVETDI